MHSLYTNGHNTRMTPLVKTGNVLWRRTLYIADLLLRRGTDVFIEHPSTSWAWQWPETVKLIARHSLTVVDLDMCAWWDPADLELPSQRPTRIITSVSRLASFGRRCPGDHQHATPLRGRRAKASGVYPWSFCRAVASAFESQLAASGVVIGRRSLWSQPSRHTDLLEAQPWRSSLEIYVPGTLLGFR